MSDVRCFLKEYSSSSFFSADASEKAKLEKSCFSLLCDKKTKKYERNSFDKSDSDSKIQIQSLLSYAQ